MIAATFFPCSASREKRRGRNRQKREPAAYGIRRFHNEFAIELHDVGGVIQIPEHGSRDHGIHRMRLEQEGRDHAEVSAAAAQRPEQVAVLLCVGDHEPAVGQNHVGAQQIVDGQAELARQMSDAAAERQAADAGSWK